MHSRPTPHLTRTTTPVSGPVPSALSTDTSHSNAKMSTHTLWSGMNQSKLASIGTCDVCELFGGASSQIAQV